MTVCLTAMWTLDPRSLLADSLTLTWGSAHGLHLYGEAAWGCGAAGGSWAPCALGPPLQPSAASNAGPHPHYHPRAPPAPSLHQRRPTCLTSGPRPPGCSTSMSAIKTPSRPRRRGSRSPPAAAAALTRASRSSLGGRPAGARSSSTEARARGATVVSQRLCKRKEMCRSRNQAWVGGQVVRAPPRRIRGGTSGWGGKKPGGEN